MLSACWLIGAYFLAVSSHKRGRLNTSVYGTVTIKNSIMGVYCILVYVVCMFIRWCRMNHCCSPVYEEVVDCWAKLFCCCCLAGLT